MASDAARDLLKRCNWPDLPDRFDLALREAVRFILERFAPLGIVASGTILRGHPDPSSDLDIYVIHRQPFRQRIQKFFHGVPAEIFVNPPAAIERYLVEEQASRRPLTAHMLATGTVILELDPTVSALRAQARASLAKPPESPPDLTMARYGPALLYEDAVDVAGHDPATAHMILCRAVTEMLCFCFIRSGRFLPRSKDLLRELAALDSETAENARKFFAAPDIVSRLDLAGQIADRTIAARGFFEWETAPETISEIE
jgi:hypothetical protein